MPLTLLAPPRLHDAIAGSPQAPLRLPNLEALLAGSSIALSPLSAEAWLCARLGIECAGEPPVAALRLAAEGDEFERAAKDGYWLCADPVAATMGMDSVRIDGAIADLDAIDAARLVASLSDFFAADGLSVIAPVTSRWYVRCESAQRLVTTPLAQAVGKSMLAHFPTGEDAPAWRARLNETQMLLHASTINAAREERGQMPVASCWFWGGGRWPARRPADVDVVHGAGGWIAAACRAGTIATEPLAAGRARLAATAVERVLVLLDDGSGEAGVGAPSPALRQWQQLDDGWFGPLRQALAARSVAAATLVLPWGDRTLTVTMTAAGFAVGWRRWRRWIGGRPPAATPVASALAPWLQ